MKDIEVEDFSDVINKLRIANDNSRGSIFSEIYRKVIPQQAEGMFDTPKGPQKLRYNMATLIYSAIANDDSIYLIYSEVFKQELGKESGEQFFKRVDTAIEVYEDRIKELGAAIEIVKGFVKRGVSK